MARLFGTDGVRGIANKDLTVDLAYKLGQAGAKVLGKNKGGFFIIGKDTRLSGDMLEAALSAGICSAGFNVMQVGVVPTPVVAYLTRISKAEAGIVISASHNPSEYNGIKFFGSNGFKLPDEVEDEIEEIINKGIDTAAGSHIGRISINKQIVGSYIEHAINTINTSLEGLNIAIDCGNGAAFELSPTIFRNLGANVMALNTNPDGLNINLNCGSTHIEYVQEIVTTHDVTIGFAHDGDADRVIAVDENGEVVDGDYIMAICAAHLKEKGLLEKNTIISTVMANLGFDIAMKKQGIEVVKTKVGDRYVLEEMLARSVSIGGEQSGHIIFLEHNTTGDGIITALQLASVMMETGKKLSELKQIMQKLPQVLVNVRVNNVFGWDSRPSILNAIEKAEKELNDNGRVLVRASGTEPLIRIMVESDTKEKASSIAQDIAKIVESELG